MRSELPTGTVTFLFSDIEGSTKLLRELGDEAYAQALGEHHRRCREAWAAHRGLEVDTEGDAFFVVFAEAADALAAAWAAQEALADGPVRVRMGLHTGGALLTETGYVGRELHLAARIAASGHGGQVVCSEETRRHAAENAAFVSLGEHRLKDFDEAVPLFQFGSERFPPLKTISNTNLPRPASSFVGREAELLDLLSVLEGGARLLTLTGPGGSGKTRLAIEAAASLVLAYQAGVFWVGLANLRDPALVSETIAQTLGAKDGLAEHIAERELLLLLDNLEQVVEAAPELASLVEACPNLRLLVTSRELLRVRGEVEYPVPPLAESEAVELFCTRSAHEPDDTIGELCGRLDNLPLAVELAAARTSVLSPPQILERLAKRLDLLKGGRDAEARQQTLRATIEWSHELLEEDEQALFARLAVFAGSCTLEAAEEVADADLDTLQSLAEKSLLRFTNERYWMLETIREYALERLEETGEADDLRRRHAAHYLRRATEAGWLFWGAEGQRWRDQAAADQDDFRTAFETVLEGEETEGPLLMAAGLWRLWMDRGQLDEGERWLTAALEHGDRAPSELRAWVLGLQGEFPRFRGEFERAIAIKEEALLMARTARNQDAGTVASLLHDLGEMRATRGEFEAARVLHEEALELRRELGVPMGIAHALHGLAELEMYQREYQRARELYEEILEIARPEGDAEAICLNSASLGECLRRLGDEERARSLLAEGLELSLRLPLLSIAPEALEAFAALAVSHQPQRAAVLIGAAEALRDETGFGVADPVEHERVVSNCRAQLGTEAFATRCSEGRAMTLEQAADFALEARDG
jgi:predicted ATPase